MRSSNAYRKVAVQTSDPRELVVMLYDGFLRFAFKARAAMMREQSVEVTQATGRALAIVTDLLNTLDHNPEPELSRQLEALYLYISDRLLKVSLHQDIEVLDEVIGLMSELRGAWAQALEQLRRDEAA